MARFHSTHGNLELRREGMDPGDEGSGLRHYLAGRPVRCGTILELLMEDGTWKPVSYEAQLQLRKGRDAEGNFVEYPPVPTLHFAVRVAGKPKSTSEDEVFFPVACIDMPSWATLRWPERGR